MFFRKPPAGPSVPPATPDQAPTFAVVDTVSYLDRELVELGDVGRRIGQAAHLLTNAQLVEYSATAAAILGFATREYAARRTGPSDRRAALHIVEGGQ